MEMILKLLDHLQPHKLKPSNYWRRTKIAPHTTFFYETVDITPRCRAHLLGQKCFRGTIVTDPTNTLRRIKSSAYTIGMGFAVGPLLTADFTTQNNLSIKLRETGIFWYNPWDT